MPELIAAQKQLGLSDTEVAAAVGLTSSAWWKAKKHGKMPKFEASIKLFVTLKKQQLLIDFLKNS